MLILSRKKGEIVTIGKAVQIEILEYDRGRVVLGINAPKNIPVHRKEVFDAIVKQNQQSVATNVPALKQALTNISLTDNK